MSDLHDLPDEVAAAISEHEIGDSERLRALGAKLSSLREEYVSYRKSSGVEQIWRAAEEAYLGIDDSNRGANTGQWSKPTTMQGSVTTGASRGSRDDTQSTAFVRLTSRYVDAATAKVAEILLPLNDKAFSFTATPSPDLIAGLKNKGQAVHNGMPLERNPLPGEAAPVPGAAVPPQGSPSPADPAAAAPAAPGPSIPVTVSDIASEALEQANAAAKKAETRIYDWMVQSMFPREIRKIIFDEARLGVGVLKGPFPVRKVRRALEGKKLIIKEEIANGYTWVDPWNLFPDPACGEDIRSGDGIFEYDQFSEKQLRSLKGSPGYIKTAIDDVIKEGPKGNTETSKPMDKHNKHRYGIWYYYGTLKKEDLVAAGAMKKDDKSPDEVYAICTMVNDTVIRATINPLDSGEFPYHSVPWLRRPGSWVGVGVGEQLEMPQRAINAATRAMFNNVGKSAGSIVVADREAIEPANPGDWTLRPDSVFYKLAGATADDVRKAFAFFQIPNMTHQLMEVINYILRMAEESTNIPLVTQGQSGQTTPETFGATQLQNNNANQLLRSVAAGFDDHITEPVVMQSYEMLLLDDTVPDDEKGDWTINAHGSTALVERAIQDQTIQQMGEFALNPAFGVNPKRWFAQYSKTKHLNPSDFQNTPEEQAKIDSQPPAPPPAVQVAQIKSADAKAALGAEQQSVQMQGQIDQAIQKMADEAKLQIAAMRKEVDELRVKRDTDRDTVFVNAETQRTQVESIAKDKELALRRELAMLDYANKHNLKLEDIKAQLADTQMRLQTQKELSNMGHAVDLHKHHNPPPEAITPPTEPAGKAAPGDSFAA